MENVIQYQDLFTEHAELRKSEKLKMMRRWERRKKGRNGEEEALLDEKG